MKLKTVLLTTVAALALTANVHAATEGKDYTVLAKPIPQNQADKIEVLEFFGYFCVHCYHLDPVLLKHAKTFPSDTYLRTEHVVWQPEMLGFARVAAAVNSSGLKYQANQAVFRAVYEEKINLADSATFKQWAAAQKGFDGKKLIAAYDSFGNQAQAKRMEDLTNTYQISGTPAVIVGGKYQVKFTGDWQAGMKTIDELVAKVRTERGMKKPSAKPVAVAPALKSKGALLAKAANK
ncbi:MULTISPECIES: thiol:disulfide interchange protein DsbA/DsbL [unclassified Neisseria]|uniref:thiol:disulfide interchange protein DsbA/DsbL n=1 Tax=unclassified Neisseria TaxID=2623750 RepID=UPI002665C95A|nr:MULTISPECIES: thiol:disulfide interchange protein DsbA/DsbL [unclassified Neisseria]MDO1510593.1 thiol:disulfide interchange protein DsbA/DsbL [Neisseria sp. MVDL19-042950]MDO1516283.1 thiol:disulfide interchange protein DsbA/DsbL [Neisseria sp. MVDL18-041461]MDO1564245.1 thiol:disulfide interchange protein DsbA/DsbL [Neisseria sp. MVDL20-010259]